MPGNMYLSLRRWRYGGPRRSPPKKSPLARQPRRRVVLLVHGYNVSEPAARSSFEGFERNLNRIWPSLVQDCCWVLWPGDAVVPGASAMSYWRKVRTSRRCAGDLATYLDELRDPDGLRPQIAIVAHSLGCRLVLEALGSLHDSGEQTGDMDVVVILMAAAVPITMLGDAGMLQRSLSLARSHVLYSRWDSTLANWFPIGQRAALEWRYPLEAVGLRGRPFGRNVWQFRRELTFHDHSDYWESEIAAALVARWLGGPVAPASPTRSAIPPREHFWREHAEWRSTPEYRELPARKAA